MTQRFQRTLRPRIRRLDGLLHLAVDAHDVVLDQTTEFLWQLLASPRTLEELADALAGEYGILAEDVRSDVAEVVADLTATGFVTEVNRP